MELPPVQTFPGELATKPKDHLRCKDNYTPLSPLSDLLSDALNDATPKANS